MKVLSLFDGISCARIALERVGIEVENYYASEVNKYAIQVSQKNYPDIVQIGDVKKIEYKYMKGSKNNEGYYLLGDPDRPLLVDTMRKTDIDLLIGGSPCQDLSIAKKDRKGLDGERSGLFRDYIRLWKEIKPKRFVLENVASMPKKDKQIISKIFGRQPIMINASLVSAQNRKRYFWTNIPVNALPKDRGILLNDILEDGNSTDLKSYCITANYSKMTKQNYLKGQGQIVKVLPGRIVGRRINSDNKRADNDKSIKIEQRVEINFNLDKTNTLSTVQKDNVLIFQDQEQKIRKLTPIECERLQGVPDNYTLGSSNSQRYKTLGNAFNVDVVAHILSFIPR